ncbi:MAG: hypothetical protein PHT54_00920 [Candidatus Nanoarchaeia archaeon]|nr:hypothetical protein [Candidatus Nanoarchaeia archaeon]
MKLMFISDNEFPEKWEGVVNTAQTENPSKIISLGDNLPTGPRESVGADSPFKQTLKDLTKQGKITKEQLKEMSLENQLGLVYDTMGHDVFMSIYSMAPEFIKNGALYIRNSSLPRMLSITGNREFDYEKLLEFIAKKQNVKSVNYIDELNGTNKFDLLTLARSMQIDSTGFLLIPYSPNLKEVSESLEDCYDKINEMNPSRLVILTHENPYPEGLGVTNRPVKTKEILEAAMNKTKEIATKHAIYKRPTLFCGHLAMTSNLYEKDGVDIQPLSADEAILYNSENGGYDKLRIC